MTRKEQIRFVREMTKTIANEMADQIKRGSIPKEWYRGELGELICRNASFLRFGMNGKQKKEFNKIVKVSGL